ncbi:alpha/beta hydrolase [Luteimonas sp. SX5]|uniref:Alpha/beta hydrolase n=1 Tax=Luteimonas galliterrae TaxID=2940486 RepID=A0ABT0MJA1_9GAMM|nr:alpha/beta hydrolase [Luteimonas galliterrae]MCL1634944.1 alpha/beta hydrolase [Luteimonas galliterrae]
MDAAPRKHLRLSGGTKLAFVSAGDPAAPAVLLMHGFASSADTFRDVIPALAEVAHVIAPDLPGYGASEPLEQPSFDAFGEAVFELLAHLNVGPRHVYLHDWGAPVGLHVAMKEPDAVLGLIVQNANAHRSGFGPQWADTLTYWAHPNAKNEAASLTFLNYEGVRAQYVEGVPSDVAARISPEVWEEDWRIMQLPGRMETQRALLLDYGKYVARFGEISEYLAGRQPPAVMVWGRHDAFFEIDETVSWMQDLPRMESHVLDGGHFLLETHAAPAAAIFRKFVAETAAAPKAGR